MTFNDLINSLPKQDLWTYLCESKKPIIMYGMGNGADKICEVLSKYNIEVSDFFASDEFVRGQSFRGKEVLTFAKVKEKYKDFVILVSFGTKLDSVICRIVEISNQNELYLPDVPVAGTEIFNFDFFNSNSEKIKKAFELLADDESKDVFANTILYKLTGEIKYLLKSTEETSKSLKAIFKTEKWKTFVDLGAYNGDTVKETLSISPKINKVIAFEPDVKNFKKLEKYFSELSIEAVAHNICAWDKQDTLSFDSSGNRNSTISTLDHTASLGDTKKISIPANSVDNVVADEKVDYINFDVEGAEMQALNGASGTIKSHSPDLLVAAYHRSEDIFGLLIKLSEMMPDYKLYMRRRKCLPAWELNIFATKK